LKTSATSSRKPPLKRDSRPPRQHSHPKPGLLRERVGDVGDQGGLSLRVGQSQPYIRVMNLDLADEETAALTQELHDIVENDR
jgi:hypothetical protein